MKQFGKQANQIRELVEINMELMEENVALKAQVARLQKDNSDYLKNITVMRQQPPVADTPAPEWVKELLSRNVITRERDEMLERNRAAMLGTKVNLSAFDEDELSREPVIEFNARYEELLRMQGNVTD